MSTSSNPTNTRTAVLQRAAACPLGDCPLNAALRQFPLKTHGNATSPYVLVGEAPGEASLKAGRPWSGPAGQALRKMFRAAAQRYDLTDLDLEDVFYLTDLVRCHPVRDGGGNRAPRAGEWRSCAPYLGDELAASPRPRIVLIAGYRNAERIATVLELSSVDFHGEGWRGGAGRVYRLQHPSPINPTSQTLPYRVSVTELFARVLADRLDLQGEAR